MAEIPVCTNCWNPRPPGAHVCEPRPHPDAPKGGED
jgi:hypothetical protein